MDAQSSWITLAARRLADFEAMCHFHQTSPNSHFTRKETCSMATADGRVTISGKDYFRIELEMDAPGMAPA